MSLPSKSKHSWKEPFPLSFTDRILSWAGAPPPIEVVARGWWLGQEGTLQISVRDNYNGFHYIACELKIKKLNMCVPYRAIYLPRVRK